MEKIQCHQRTNEASVYELIKGVFCQAMITMGMNGKHEYHTKLLSLDLQV